MIHLSNSLLLLYLLVYTSHSSLVNQTLLGTVPGLSTRVNLNKTTAISSTQSYTRSQPTYSVNNSGIHASSLISIPNPLPSPFQGDGWVDLQNYQDIKSGFCAINDNYCSFEGNNRTTDLTTKVLDDQCLLWDTSCSGNRTLAIDEFFNTTQGLLFDNLCFSQFSSGVPSGETDISIPEEQVGSSLVEINDVIPSDCKKYNPPERLSEWQDIKSWMRSSGCVSAQNEWIKGGGQGAYNFSSQVTPSCCGFCDVGAENVDLYYWPEPGANTSCLSIVGASVNPIAYGATTGLVGDSESGTYWACSAKIPATSTYTYAGANSANSETITSVYPTITTATITTIGSLAVKVSLINPWSPSPCIETDTFPRVSNGSNGLNISTEIHVRHAVQARGRTLLIPSSITQENGTPVSTVVLGKFTFTSPSVYANFYGIEASDSCGQTTMSSTMLSFFPGELSSIEGPLAGWNGQSGSLSTKKFDFRDLPCPPQSIMEADWYKPEPGVPYRPLIAMPSQLKQRVPWLSFCEDIFFSAYDPPTALDSATAFVPVITPGSDHRIQALAAAPSPTIDPGARMTTAGKFSTSASMVGAAAQQTSPLQAHFDPEDSSSDPERGIEKVQSSNINEDPGKQTEPNVPGLPLQHNAAVNSNLDLSVPDHLLLQPTAGTENSIDPNVPDLPLQPTATIKSNQDPTLNAGAVAHNEQKESVDESSTGSESGASKITDPEDTPPADPPQNPNSGSKAPTQAPQHILTTIAGHAITAAPTAVAIAGTTINPGDTGVTLGGTPVALDRSGRLLLGTKTIPLPSGLPEKITTTIAGQAITADSAAVAMESKTLKPGDLAMNVNGTSVALDTAGRFFIGSNIVPFATESANPLVTTIAGQVITAAANAIGIAGTTMKPGDTGFPINGTVLSLDTAGHFVVGATTHTFQSEIASLTVAALGAGGSITTIMPSATQSNASIGIYDIPSTSVQVFTGEAGGLKWSLICLKTVVVIFVMITLVHA